MARSQAFFKALGLSFNPQFTNEQGACLEIAENIYAMLLVEPFFQGFTKLPMADATQEHRSADRAVVRQPRRGRRAGGQGGGGRRHHAQRADRTTASCTSTALPTWTATSGRCSGWTRAPRRRRCEPACTRRCPPGHRRRLAHRVGAHHGRGRAHGARRRRGRGAGAGRAGRRAGALAARRACPTTPAPG